MSLEDESDGSSSHSDYEDEITTDRPSKRLRRNKVHVQLEHLEPDDEDGTFDDDIRPGRYIGSDSNWRKYTKAERALAASLDHVEANDLSVHLYSVHSLKTRRYAPRRSEKFQDYLPKSTWFDTSRGGNGEFIPETRWTAWPMDPADVPRSREIWGTPTIDPAHDSDTIRSARVWYPEREMSEELKAIMLRRVKERFIQRGWHINPPEGESMRKGHEEVKPDDAKENRPFLSIDDETLEEYLSPPASHVIQKYGDLLVKLHTCRTNPHWLRQHAREQIEARKKWKRRYLNTSLDVESQSSRADTEVDHRTKEDNASEDSHDDSDGISKKIHLSSPTTKSPRRTQRRPRDWSELLRVAAMVGFDAQVLQRTKDRCASLFNEDMDLRLHESLPAPVTLQEEDVILNAEDEGTSQDSSTEPIADTGHASSGYACPDIYCARHLRPYAFRGHLLVHIDRKHGRALESMEDELKRREFRPEARDAQSDSRQIISHLDEVLLQPVTLRWSSEALKIAAKRTAADVNEHDSVN